MKPYQELTYLGRVRRMRQLATAALVLLGFLLPAGSLAQETEPPATEARHCTVFAVAKGNQVFFGGNDDYIEFDSHYWVDPGRQLDYGAVWIGTRNNVQQGVNEQGLAYDATGLPRVDVASHPERTPVVGGYASYPIQILRECATVKEVIEWVHTHEWHTYMHDQMQFADASGDSVIISAGTDGELVFTRKPPGDGYLVSTNYNVANPSNGFGYPCWRYDKAQELLDQLVNGDDVLDARKAAAVLDAVHVEGGTSWTLASMLADLPNGLVYVYLWVQFDDPVILNVAEEIAQARTDRPLSKLFPEDVQQEAARRYQHIQAKADRCQWIGTAWLAMVLLCLVVLTAITLYKRSRLGRRRDLIFWLPLVAILGPFGLLIWLITGRRQQVDGWRAALLEAAGDVMPLVVAFVTFLFVVFLVPEAQTAGPLQLVLLLGLPLLFEWLIFQGALLAWGARKPYVRILVQRLPQALVAANLGMAGLNAVTTALFRWSVSTCSILPLSPWTVASWWAFAALGAMLGTAILCLYEFWAVGRGFRAWSVLASGEGDPIAPSWRQLWWWILLSFVALFAGLVVSAIV